MIVVGERFKRHAFELRPKGFTLIFASGIDELADRAAMADETDDRAQANLVRQAFSIEQALDVEQVAGMLVSPPPAGTPAGTPDEFPTKFSPKGIDPNGWPIGGGFRVPCIIVSPWTVGGWVCSEQFDHTSNLRLLELVTGVKAPNISGWRREAFGDLTSALRLGQPAARPPRLPDTSAALDVVERAVTTQPRIEFPTSHQVEPTQAPGKRPVTPVIATKEK